MVLFYLSSVLSGEADRKERTRRVRFHQRLLRNLISVFLTPCESDAKSYGCDLFHSRTRVICCRVSTALAYTFAGPLSLKQNGVFTCRTTSGCTDQHTAHSPHIGSGAGYRSFRQFTIRSSRELHGGRRHLPVPGYKEKFGLVHFRRVFLKPCATLSACVQVCAQLNKEGGTCFSYFFACLFGFGAWLTKCSLSLIDLEK